MLGKSIVNRVRICYISANLRDRNDIIDVKCFFFAIEEVPWSADAPINAAIIGAFDVIIGVFAFGHDTILAYASLTPLEFVVQEDFSDQVCAILAIVVVGPGAVGKSTIFAAHLSNLLHLFTIITFALE